MNVPTYIYAYTHTYTTHTDILTLMCIHTETHIYTHRDTYTHRHTDAGVSFFCRVTEPEKFQLQTVLKQGPDRPAHGSVCPKASEPEVLVQT